MRIDALLDEPAKWDGELGGGFGCLVEIIVAHLFDVSGQRCNNAIGLFGEPGFGDVIVREKPAHEFEERAIEIDVSGAQQRGILWHVQYCGDDLDEREQWFGLRCAELHQEMCLAVPITTNGFFVIVGVEDVLDLFIGKHYVAPCVNSHSGLLIEYARFIYHSEARVDHERGAAMSTVELNIFREQIDALCRMARRSGRTQMTYIMAQAMVETFIAEGGHAEQINMIMSQVSQALNALDWARWFRRSVDEIPPLLKT